MEEGEGSVWILVDPDPGLDVVVSGWGGGDLEDAPFVAHGVVAGDCALCVQAEDVAANSTWSGRTRGTKALSSSSGGVAKRRLWSGR